MDNFRIISAWSQTNMDMWVFYLLAFMAIPFAYGVLFDPRIIRCGFLLIGVFGAMAGLFLLLQAQFLAMAQLMIYAVGITLVVVIALMLTNPKLEHDVTPSLPLHRGPGIMVAVTLFITIYLALRSEPWPVSQEVPSGDNVLAIGNHLLTTYSLPFEFASVLLLVALIGAIMLAKAEHEGLSRPEEWIDEEELYSERKDHVVKV